LCGYTVPVSSTVSLWAGVGMFCVVGGGLGGAGGGLAGAGGDETAASSSSVRPIPISSSLDVTVGALALLLVARVCLLFGSETNKIN